MSLTTGSRDSSPAISRKSADTSPLPAVRPPPKMAAGGADDFKQEYASPPGKEFECPVCVKIVRYPVKFPGCGHSCCTACLKELARSVMMTSSNFFRVTGPLCGEFTGHRWIPLTKGQWHGALMFSLICALNKRLSKQSWGWWFGTPSGSLWRHCNERKISISSGHFSSVQYSAVMARSAVFKTLTIGTLNREYTQIAVTKRRPQQVWF